jgi:hypothetical protein
MLEHAQLTQLLAGKNNPLWICSIPDRARGVLGCSSGAVYLSTESARHILTGHGDIDEFSILLLPIAIEQGRLLRERKRPRCVNAIYYGDDGKIYFVAMKTAQGGHELWVSSMYRLLPRQVATKTRNADPI